MKRKYSWTRLFWICVFLSIILVLILFWDTILIRVAPKAVLTTALKTVCSQLEERFRDDPLLIVANSLNPDGRYAADVTINAVDDLSESVEYNISLQTDIANKQLSVSGTTKLSDVEFDYTLYMDDKFFAISSGELLSEQYYGITYETFLDDIRSIPLLDFFVSDKMLEQWDISVRGIQTLIRQLFSSFPQLPMFNQINLQTFLFGILTLPCEIEERSVSIDNSLLNCHAISYTTNTQNLDQIRSDVTYTKDDSVTVTFYLYHNSLIKIQVQCFSETKNETFAIDLGKAPVEGPLNLQGSIENNGIASQFSITVNTQKNDVHYEEKWSLSQSGISDSAEDMTLYFDYQPSSGIMKIESDKICGQIEILLKKKENGFQVNTNNLAQLIRVFQVAGLNISEQSSCTLHVSKGSQIEIPTFININQWSLEDFWSLLNSVGTLLGINVIS